VDKYIQRMAQMSRTPMSYYQITGQVASADTQKADETGLVSKTERIAKFTGERWELVADACRRLHNAFGTGVELPEEPITTIWKPFERVDKGALEKSQAETNDIKSQVFERHLLNNVERELAAQLAGYDDETAKKMAEVSRPFLGGGITQ